MQKDLGIRLRALQARVEWKSFALGMVCLAFGIENIYLGTWFNDAAAVLALFMAGMSVSGSLLKPIIDGYTRRFNEMKTRWQSYQPDAIAKAAAADFRAQIGGMIEDMRQRGEIPQGMVIDINLGDRAPPSHHPDRKLN